MRRVPAAAALVLIVVLQTVCSLFFVWDIGAGILGLRREPLSWQARELMEIGASLGLVLGVGFGAALLVRALRSQRDLEGRLRQLSGAFGELLQQRFAEWGLTPSERDVAWFTVKGLSIAEIAQMRHTSEGTVKAQSNAIYRKSGVNGRAQLLSLLIDDLMDETRRPAPQVEAAAPLTKSPRPRDRATFR